MKSTKRFFILALKILIVSAMLLAIPASANPPILVEGSVSVNGDPAVAGTVIEVVADGNVVGSTVVENAGSYGDTRSNRLGIPYGYESVTLFVNGVETEVIDLSGLESGETFSVDLKATQVESPGSSGSSTVSSSSSSSGSSEGSAVSTADTTGSESDVALAEGENKDNAPVEETPTSETVPQSQAESAFPTTIVVAAFAIICILAAVAVSMNRGKK